VANSADMAAGNAADTAAAGPSIRRRLISMIYELLLALAVLFIPFLILEMATGASHVPVVEHLRQALAFIVMGAYFIHQWSREGQTLAMKTWRLKLVMPGRTHVPLRIAAARYLLAWMWLLPALLADYALGLGHWTALAVVGAGVLLWSATALFTGNGQFLHDKLLGTQLVLLPAPQRRKKPAPA
jgi:uncharacterized RDD family membrane protein YckC